MVNDDHVSSIYGCSEFNIDGRDESPLLLRRVLCSEYAGGSGCCNGEERFSATTMFARNTSAATALFVVVVVVEIVVFDGLEFALICSLSLFTDDRETKRIGLSLDRL